MSLKTDDSLKLSAPHSSNSQLLYNGNGNLALRVTLLALVLLFAGGLAISGWSYFYAAKELFLPTFVGGLALAGLSFIVFCALICIRRFKQTKENNSVKTDETWNNLDRSEQGNQNDSALYRKKESTCLPPIDPKPGTLLNQICWLCSALQALALLDEKLNLFEELEGNHPHAEVNKQIRNVLNKLKTDSEVTQKDMTLLYNSFRADPEFEKIGGPGGGNPVRLILRVLLHAMPEKNNLLHRIVDEGCTEDLNVIFQRERKNQVQKTLNDVLRNERIQSPLPEVLILSPISGKGMNISPDDQQYFLAQPDPKKEPEKYELIATIESGDEGHDTFRKKTGPEEFDVYDVDKLTSHSSPLPLTQNTQLALFKRVG